MDSPFRLGDAPEHAHRALAHPGGEGTSRDQSRNRPEVTRLVVSRSGVGMTAHDIGEQRGRVTRVGMVVVPRQSKAGIAASVPAIVMNVGMIAIREVRVAMLLSEVNLQLCPGDASFGAARRVQVVSRDTQAGQTIAQGVEVHSQVEECAEEHVSADAAEDVEVDGLHAGSPLRALIWLAA
jgi:hypothetical protein